MNISTHVRGGLRIAAALATALLIMISPLCAPLCAATACASRNSSPDSSPDSCHHASASTANCSSAMAAPQLCNLKELPAAARRDAKPSEQYAKRIPLHAFIIAADQLLASRLSQSLRLPDCAALKDKPSASTVLRI
jgi:hypothetical protein